MLSLSRFLEHRLDIPVAPVTIREESIWNLEQILDAGTHVGQHFGIEIDHDLFRNALLAAKSHRELVPALEASGIGILDYHAVRRYQRGRVRRTLRQRLSQGWDRLRGLSDRLLHGWTGKTSAWLAFFVTIPLGLPLLIDLLWYDVAVFSWYLSLVCSQILLGCLTMAFYGVGNERLWIKRVGKQYARLNHLLVGLPLRIGASLVGSWFMTGESGRRWAVMSIKEFVGMKASREIPVLLMSRVLQAAPDATLEFEALVNADGTRDGEAFLLVDLDGDLEGDKLHIWHGRV